MKPYTYSLLAAALACGMAHGATAYTTPVGYVTLDIPVDSDSTISPPLDRSSLFVGLSSSISGNDVGASSLTAGAFTSSPCYLQVTSGALVGRRYPVTGNTATAITVDPVTAGTLQSQGFVSGDTFKVVPYWTLATLFPAGAGVGGTNDVFTISSLVYVSDNGVYGANRAPSASYFYCTGDEANGVVAGWYDASDAFGSPKNDVVIDPTVMYYVRNGEGASNSVTVVGEVPNVSSASLLPVTTAENDVSLGISVPVDMSLQESGLQSAILGTNDVFTINELVYVFDDTSSVQNKAPSSSYFYCTGDEANGVVAGWYDASDAFGAPVTAKVLKAGRSIIVRKSAYGSDGVVTWTMPLPYSL